MLRGLERLLCGARETLPCEDGQGWHRVPRAAVAAPGSLAVPKARLDAGAEAAWDSGSCPCHSRGWHWVVFEVHSNPLTLCVNL